MDGQFNYIIKYRDIYDLSHEYKWQLEELQKGIEKMKDKINAFINDSSFKGEGADSIKAYFKERHIPMLDGINQAAQSLLDNVATYKGSYYSIDFATNFILTKESIESYNSVLYKKYTDETDGYIDAAKAALNSVSDIFSDYIYPQEAANNIGTYHEGVKTRITDWAPQISNVEYNTAYLVHQVTDAFINVIDQTNKSIGTEWADIKQYESGSLDDNVCFNSLKEISSIYNDLHNQNADVYNKIWDVEKQLDEAAAEREAQGAMKIISGIGLAITGVVCIVATWGAATPVVVAGVIAGGGTLAFAAADTIEGGQDIYYGSIGDIDSTSFNGIKSIVYACGGDDDDYNNIEQAFSFAASCMAPIGTASKMGTLTTETVITTVAKEYISNEVGNIAQEITVDVTGSKIAGIVANVVASAATSKGLDALDKPVNMDIGIDADNAKSVKTGDVDGIKPVDADIKTNISPELSGTGAAGIADDLPGANSVAKVADDLPGTGAAGIADDLPGTKNAAGIADDVPKTSTPEIEKLTPDDIIKKVENGDVNLKNTLQKGNFGEMETDAFMKDLGYERVSIETVTDLDSVGHQGIDGIYYKPDGHPPYVIAESKYGSSKLSKLQDGTLQMSDDWLTQNTGSLQNNRIYNDIVGVAGSDEAKKMYKEIMDGLDTGNTGKVLSKVDKVGNVSTFLLDSSAKKIGTWP